MGGDGMSDLVERLRDPRGNSPTSMDGYEHNAVGFRDKMCAEAAERIEQLERELVEARCGLEAALLDGARFCVQLAAEKALADDLYDQVVAWVGLRPEDADSNDDVAMNSYRKARGL